MIAKIVACSRDRSEALLAAPGSGRDDGGHQGGATNKGFVLDLLGQPEVIDATADAGWIDRESGEGCLLDIRHSAVALTHAAVGATAGEEESARGGC